MNCNFSFKHYEEILKAALKSNYEFIDFAEFIKRDKNSRKNNFLNQKICLLRHDIDYEFTKNYNIARIEHNLGLKSTFFIQCTSWEYNSRDRDVFKIAKELSNMGHQIGVHLDMSWYKDIDINNVQTYFEKEKKLLSNNLDIEVIDIFSCHNAHKLKELVLNKVIPGVRSTYEPLFFSKIKYLSDSQGWYEGCMCEIFKKSKYPKIQLLTHSYIWDEVPEVDFTKDIAKMITCNTKDFYKLMLSSHPVCKKNEEKLKKEIIKKINKW